MISRSWRIALIAGTVGGIVGAGVFMAVAITLNGSGGPVESTAAAVPTPGTPLSDPAPAVLAPSSPPASPALVADSGKPPGLSDTVAKAADYVNTTVPKHIDSVTTLVAMRADGTRLTYVYALSQTMSESDIEALHDPAAQSVCRVAGLRLILDQGGTIGFEYWDANQTSILGGFVVSTCL